MEKFNIKDIKDNFVSFKTLGDGSCLLHSLLFCFNKTYRKSNVSERLKISRDLRNNLSKVLKEENKITKKTYYEELSRGDIGNISKEIPQMRLKYMEKFLLSNNWLDIFYLELISNQLDLDIYIINSDGSFYQLGDKEIFYKNRRSVIVKYIDQAHFEAVGLVINNKKVETLFNPEFSLIKKLKEKLKMKKV